MEKYYVKMKISGNAKFHWRTALSEVNASCILSCIMSTVLLSWGWYCSVPQACAVHLSRQLAKLSWLINNHAMVLDQCTSNVLRLSALFLLRLYSAWLRKCKGGVGSFYCLSACRRGVSACSHQSPLWHELHSYCRICLSTWPNAIGRELPIAQHPHPPNRPPPPAVLPSLCLCKLCKCRGSSGDEAYSSGISLTRVASSTCEPASSPGMPSMYCPPHQLHQMHF